MFFSPHPHFLLTPPARWGGVRSWTTYICFLFGEKIDPVKNTAVFYFDLCKKNVLLVSSYER